MYKQAESSQPSLEAGFMYKQGRTLARRLNSIGMWSFIPCSLKPQSKMALPVSHIHASHCSTSFCGLSFSISSMVFLKKRNVFLKFAILRDFKKAE